MHALLISTLVMVMTACNGLFNTEPFADTRRDEQGNVVLLDTERNWRDFVETVNLQVNSEAAGKNPPGISSWNKHWLRRIEHNRASRENGQKYIDYIIDARQRAGLPPLEGL